MPVKFEFFNLKWRKVIILYVLALAVSFVFVVCALKTVSRNNRVSQNTFQSKVLPVKKIYGCRNVSTSISDYNTRVCSNGKIILLWTTWFGKNFVKYLGNSRPITCGHNRNKCFLTGDKNLYSDSSAVVFHIPESDLLKSIISANNMSRPPHQRWIFYTKEPPPRIYGYDEFIPYSRFLFNWTMTYKFSSDIRQSYFFIVPGKFKNGYDSNKNYLENRTKTAIAFISNCKPQRLDAVRKLKKYIDVDVYGKCGKPCKPNCFSLLPKYKFYLAFENSICEDYITEKTYKNSLKNEIVPVIISGANLSNPEVVPPNSFINGLDFKRAVYLANYLKKIGSDPQLYNKFFKWRDEWTIRNGGTYSLPCDVCNKLYEPNQRITVYDDIEQWYSVQHDCKQYPTWENDIIISNSKINVSVKNALPII